LSEQGDYRLLAHYLLAEIYLFGTNDLPPDQERGLSYFKSSYELGFKCAGTMYALNRIDEYPDENQWLKDNLNILEDCAMHDRTGAFPLGLHYLEGVKGLEKDLNKAEKYLEESFLCYDFRSAGFLVSLYGLKQNLDARYQIKMLQMIAVVEMIINKATDLVKMR